MSRSLAARLLCAGAIAVPCFASFAAGPLMGVYRWDAPTGPGSASSASASENARVGRVEFFVDGAQLLMHPTSANGGNLNTTALGNGTHVLKAVASDAQGPSAKRQMSFSVQNTPDSTSPNIVLTSPATNTVLGRRTTVSLAATASDNVGVSAVEFAVNGRRVCRLTAAPYTCSWFSGGKPRNTYSITATAIDTAGNRASDTRVISGAPKRTTPTTTAPTTTTTTAPTTTTTTAASAPTTTSPTTPTAATPTTTQSLLAREVSRDADLRNHPEILWYGNLDNLESAMLDWTMSPAYAKRELPGSTDPYGMKFQFVDVPEFGTRGVRWTSMSLNPDTRWPGSTDGSTIMNWSKYINNSTLAADRARGWAYNNGSAVGNVPLNDLYMRYCVMLESDVWTGLNETGFKLGGLEKLSQGTPGYSGGPFWHRRPVNGKIYFNTYWFGKGYDDLNGGYGAQELPESYEMRPNMWHCMEQHLKLNTTNPDGTPNADAELEAWFDDVLVYSRKNFVIHNTAATPNEIKKFHGQLFHGGTQTPLTPIHYRVTGFALAKRRIGAPQRLQ